MASYTSRRLQGLAGTRAGASTQAPQAAPAAQTNVPGVAQQTAPAAAPASATQELKDSGTKAAVFAVKELVTGGIREGGRDIYHAVKGSMKSGN